MDVGVKLSPTQCAEVIRIIKEALWRVLTTPRVATTRWGTTGKFLEFFMPEWWPQFASGLLPMAIEMGWFKGENSLPSFSELLRPSDRKYIAATAQEEGGRASTRVSQAQVARMRNAIPNGPKFKLNALRACRQLRIAFGYGVM